MRQSLLFLLLCFHACYGQKTIYSVNLQSLETDSFFIPLFDTNTTKANSDFYIGSLNEDLNNLNQDSALHYFDGTAFSKKTNLQPTYSPLDFPARTSIKLFVETGGEIEQSCSGILISPYHVLTAAHCFFGLNSNSCFVDSIYCYPNYDWGQANSILPYSSVKKVSILKDRDFGKEDWAILELNDPLGYTFGWVGYGYNDDSLTLVNHNYLRFTYPGKGLTPEDEFKYNGDTLFYNLGKITTTNDEYLSVLGAIGAKGESGGSLIAFARDTFYVSYGVTTWASNLSHSRILDYEYYAIKEIISRSERDRDEQQTIILFPNPSIHTLFFKGLSTEKFYDISITDLTGKTVYNAFNSTINEGIEISFLSQGYYIISIENNAEVYCFKFLKLMAN